MSQPLFPVVEVPDFISEDSQYDTQYKRSMKWDPELGDFVRDGAHRIKECDGKEAFAIWCFKIAQTERYRSSLGDCTNNGISSYARELYILDAQKGPFEPDDIRQCVYIEKREVMGQEYVDCKPAYCRKRWYMAGGNILYTSDSRFKQITGISYPIAIHDRYEGR